MRITSTLGRAVNLTYSGTEQIFSTAGQCRNCNSTYLEIEGIVGFFETENIVVKGIANGILYARAVIPISYTCSEISGCQICFEINSTLACNRCFPSNFTFDYLLFEEECYSVCPASTYPSGVLCSPCPDLCYRCSDIECLECDTPYSIYNTSCVLECPPTYIRNATHCITRPVVCPLNCIDCPDDNICLKCNGGYFLLDNLCYTNCPAGYVESLTQPVCDIFVPPEETDYFPFAFFITSLIALLILIVVKCFERRSLVIGNFIAIGAFL